MVLGENDPKAPRPRPGVVTLLSWNSTSIAELMTIRPALSASPPVTILSSNVSVAPTGGGEPVPGLES